MFLLCHLPATPRLSKLSAYFRVQSKHSGCLDSVMSDFFSPMDCSLPGSSVHGISQARMLEWLLFPSPGDLPDSEIDPHPLHWQADSLPTGKAISETLPPPKSLPISADRSRSPLCVSPKSPPLPSYKVLISHSFSCPGECLHALSGCEL